jgi:hypothetical protein
MRQSNILRLRDTAARVFFAIALFVWFPIMASRPPWPHPEDEQAIVWIIVLGSIAIALWCLDGVRRAPLLDRLSRYWLIGVALYASGFALLGGLQQKPVRVAHPQAGIATAANVWMRTGKRP